MFFPPPGPALCKLDWPGELLVLPEFLTRVLGPSFVLFPQAFPALSFSHRHSGLLFPILPNNSIILNSRRNLGVIMENYFPKAFSAPSFQPTWLWSQCVYDVIALLLFNKSISHAIASYVYTSFPKTLCEVFISDINNSIFSPILP